ncbi:hypothetical protein CXB49_12480 [Chromobacterium sp. ATCC 53434]|nr:hypothetical protein CXB49_12480 [Chromobacterium sp. ATCC 53434]
MKKLVYTSIATGLIGVTSLSAAAHGNASSHAFSTIDWKADSFSVQTKDTAKVEHAQDVTDVKR